MRYYTVHIAERPVGPNPVLDPDPDPDLEIVKDGFCWAAFFLPLLWGIWRGQWFGLLAYIGVLLGSGLLIAILRPGTASQIAVTIGIALLVGFSANDWRRWRLRRIGYRDIGTFAAADADEAALLALEAIQPQPAGHRV